MREQKSTPKETQLRLKKKGGGGDRFVKGGRLLKRTLAFKWALGLRRRPVSSTFDVAPSRGTVGRLHGLPGSLLVADVGRRHIFKWPKSSFSLAFESS